MHQPEEYEKYKSFSLRDSEFFSPQLANSVPWGKNEIIVDYGCGAGSTGFRCFLPFVRKTNSVMISADCSMEMVSFAREKYPDPRVQYLLGDIMKNPGLLGFESVDKIFSFYSFHYMRSQNKLYKRLGMALKPGGFLACVVPVKVSYFQMLIFLGTHPIWKHFMKGYEEFIPDWVISNLDPFLETKKNLIEAGFIIHEFQKYKLSYLFLIDILVEFYSSANPCIHMFLKKDLSELKRDCSEFLLRHHEKDVEQHGVNTEITVKYEAMFVTAQKVSRQGFKWNS